MYASVAAVSFLSGAASPRTHWRSKSALGEPLAAQRVAMREAARCLRMVDGFRPRGGSTVSSADAEQPAAGPPKSSPAHAPATTPKERLQLIVEVAAAASAYGTLFPFHSRPSIDEMLHPTTVARRRASLLLMRGLHADRRSAAEWGVSMSTVAACVCLQSKRRYVQLLRERKVLYQATASLLPSPPLPLWALTEGADQSHLNARGHQALAAGINAWLQRECAQGLPMGPPLQPTTTSEYVCRFAPFTELLVGQRGCVRLDLLVTSLVDLPPCHLLVTSLYGTHERLPGYVVGCAYACFSCA